MLLSEGRARICAESTANPMRRYREDDVESTPSYGARHDYIYRGVARAE